MDKEIISLLAPNQKIVTLLQAIAKSGSVFVILSGFIGVLIWRFSIPLALKLFPNVDGMNPLVAAGFISAGFALFIQLINNTEEKVKWKSIASSLFSCVTLVVGLFTIASFLISTFTKYHQLLFTRNLFDSIVHLDISLSFLLVGIALLLLPIPAGKHFMRATHGLTLLAMLLSMFAVIGYLYQSLSLYSHLYFTPMPLSSAFTFTILCLSILFARPNRGFMKVLTRDTASSILSLRLTLVSLSLPAIIGYIVLQGEQLHLYDSQTRLALLVIGNISLFSVVVWLNSAALQKLELENQIIKNELERKSIKLEIDAKSLATKMLALEEEKQDAYDKLSNRKNLAEAVENTV
jgi:hypothetical protein